MSGTRNDVFGDGQAVEAMFSGISKAVYDYVSVG
jgi:hypothetical protein